MFNSSQSTLVAVHFRIEFLEFLLALVVSWVAVFFFWLIFFYLFSNRLSTFIGIKMFQMFNLGKGISNEAIELFVMSYFVNTRLVQKTAHLFNINLNKCLPGAIALQSTFLETCIFTIINNQMSEKSTFGINIICLLSLLVPIVFQQQYLALRIKLQKRLTDTYMRLASAAFSS